MAKINPFQAYRPDTQYADKIAALPYDVYNRKEVSARSIARKEIGFFLTTSTASLRL